MKTIIEGWLNIDQIAQRGCGMSILIDTENPSGHSTDQAALEDPVWAVRMDQLIFRGPFQPQQVSEPKFSDTCPE